MRSALSRVGYRVVHADRHAAYGDAWATLSVPELRQWAGEKSKNSKSTQSDSFCILELQSDPAIAVFKSIELEAAECWDDDAQLGRQFNLDLAPKLIFAKSALVEALVDTRLGNYLEFRLMARSYLYDGGKFLRVPMSKEDVFMNKDVTMVEKRKLMKFLTGVLEWSRADEPSCAPFLESTAYQTQSFLELLHAHGLTGRLTHLAAYSIALLNESDIANVPALAGLHAMSKYVESLGKYGASPFLAPIYGTSELVQAFCRYGC